MCTLLKHILNASLWGFSLLVLPAMAAQISPGRVIHSRGAAIETPCNVNTRQQQIESSCMRDGTMGSNLYDLQQVTTAPQSVQQIAAAKMHYLNEQKSMAILNIEYR